MEAYVSYLHTHQPPQISTFLCQPVNHHASGYRRMELRQCFRWPKGRLECGGGDRMMRPESKRKDEITGERWDGKDVNEQVELMEMEAIMREDDGREPMDYKRRAGIFYKSSEMFQAIKDKQHKKWDGKEDENEQVELMEMEAIMGEDDGKEPMDYKRRATIFYKSSEMFQAIKDKQHHHCA